MKQASTKINACFYSSMFTVDYFAFTWGNGSVTKVLITTLNFFVTLTPDEYVMYIQGI